MSGDILILLFFLVGLPAVGVLAWRRQARKTACAIWVGTGLLFAAAILVPSLVGPGKPYKDRHNCIANLRHIDGAVQQWALEQGRKDTNSYAFSDPALLALMRGSALPVCPAGGLYSPGATIADAPKCSLAAQGHTL